MRPALFRGFLVVLTMIVVAASFLADEPFDRWARQPIASGQAKATLASLRAWGEAPTIALVLFAAVLLKPADWRRPLAIGLTTMAVSFAVEVWKPLTGRLRPEQVQERSLGGAWHFGQGRNSSFPSGHVATAFAFARGLAATYPSLKPVCLIAAGGTAASRIRDGRHYLSDCLVGAAFGWVVAGWLHRNLRRLPNFDVRRLPPEHSGLAATPTANPVTVP